MKQTLGDLAFYGGPAAFTEPLFVGRPNIGDRKLLFERLEQALDRRWLTNQGPLVLEFEQRVAELAGARHCVAMCNATLALQIAARAMGMTGEVIMPSFTFVASPHALSWIGVTPVFCDIDPETHLMDPAHVESLIGPATTGIMGVHLWGQPCAPGTLPALARRHRLPLLYDAAHAVATRWHGRPVATLGDASVFSFHATKFVNAFEGGALVTDDDGLAATARAMRNFGQTGEDQVTYLGTNAKMSEASAAMGLTSLEAMPELLARNLANHRRYATELAGVPGVRVLPYTSGNNHQYVVMEIDERVTGVSRDLLRAVLTTENIRCRSYFAPGCHMMDTYRGSPRLPHTEAVSRRVLGLPTGTAVRDDEVIRVCEIIRFVVAHGPAIAAKVTNGSAARTSARPPAPTPR
ncbi:dTDP-4-dehydro-6-deoxyglucose aminotransferase [Sphaerisporangium rufum]|uniref:dTDP-4-dehydro-6-deoxyglucose aminotransferase n=1 Tax=Sphaerisporangium rufum TaxID=1381558 RepID=A0A919R851_9ACTN|nr:DegT/DnrJ/EryC1/StrS family aminotransferase [Sphaerisporangium rufum]GII81003.1 dTDP-4-dehydro-6-deoxyglucose aminotransferase [Sphaerisporangium rufum]